MGKDKKKGAPEGAPMNQEDYTAETKLTQAELMFERIGYGAENAIVCNDRHFRMLVSNANKSGDCIINNGGGYYRPTEDEKDELEHYLYAELHRAKEINDKVDSMREAYFGKY